MRCNFRWSFGAARTFLLGAAGVSALVLASGSAGETSASESAGRVVVVTNKFELAVVKPDGTGLRRLTRRLPEINSPRWSPNGQRIAFVRDTPNRWSPKAPIYLIQADGSGLHIVARGQGPRWSPDGRRLLFDLSGRIIVLEIASGRRRVIGRGSLPVWSPDGKQIAFMRYTYDQGDVDGSKLLTMRADGSDVRVIVGRGPKALYNPEWSPDGRTIAVYAQELGGAEEGDIERVDANSGVTRQLVPPNIGDATEVAWSPDGSKLAFVETETAMAVLQVKTGHVKVVASVVRPEFDPVVKWSPNGKQVGFIRCSGPDFQRCSLFAVSVNGSRPRPLARVPFGNDGFDWGLP
jgi:Tol biopolymer transport system component